MSTASVASASGGTSAFAAQTFRANVTGNSGSARTAGTQEGQRPQGPPPGGRPGGAGGGERPEGPPSLDDLTSKIDEQLQSNGVDEETRATVIEQITSALTQSQSNTESATSETSEQTENGSHRNHRQVRQTINQIFEQNGISTSQMRKGAFLDAQA
ncbi:hypothetical protein [Aporhodopirellula aestuarii]|uniref:Uncharacterized protein n=1 Tax=Aporhodopirellula aestuarii TaxID=2950107 RepID=A0ABT0TZK1_9BACT|nr:hypothetical protein [Aporhodopirellula aestuarii]MCM2369955.1 hypothetical protein [Aporhodopirellula aestuarii]